MGRNTDDFFKEKKDWSKVKDNILACYLKPYFNKIQYTKKAIVYIDGFAGKGKFDSGDIGSPLIAYNTAKEDNIKVTFYFIENKYYEELKKNSPSECNVIAGNYEDNIVNLIEKNKDKNLFVYIDPYGIKNLDFSYLKQLNITTLNSAEILINLNSFGFIREGCRLLKTELTDVMSDDEYEYFMDDPEEFKKKNSIEHMNKIAGGDYWQDIISKHQQKLITGYEAEKMFVNEYCDTLQKVGRFKYVINIPIRIKAGTPPKYRMVFATNHNDGIILMDDNMCKRFDELIELQNNGINTLFQENTENEIITEDSICKDLLSVIDYTNISYFTLFIRYIKRFGLMKTSIINKCLKKLELNGTIIIEREPHMTPTGRISKFIMPSNEQEVFIRLNGDSND